MPKITTKRNFISINIEIVIITNYNFINCITIITFSFNTFIVHFAINNMKFNLSYNIAIINIILVATMIAFAITFTLQDSYNIHFYHTPSLNS